MTGGGRPSGRYVGYLALLLALAGCGLSGPDHPVGSSGTRASPAGASTAGGGTQIVSPLDLATSPRGDPATVAGTTLPGSTPAVTAVFGPPDTGDSPAEQVAAVGSIYSLFLSDVAGLDDNFANHWVQSLQQIAVPSLVEEAKLAAQTLQQGQAHGVGPLQDSHRSVVISGSTARVSDCLDEYDWYVVSDATGQPRPGIARGYFSGKGVLTDQNGQWVVAAWKSESAPCRY
jgi:hypothetical protein